MLTTPSSLELRAIEANAGGVQRGDVVLVSPERWLKERAQALRSRPSSW